VSREIGFARRCAELRGFTAEISQTVENDRENGRLSLAHYTFHFRQTRETPRSLIEIALEVGYTSPSHFSKFFRRHAGITAQEFRDRL
jgi:AraC-like DNA-binding protein